MSRKMDNKGQLGKRAKENLMGFLTGGLAAWLAATVAGALTIIQNEMLALFVAGGVIGWIAMMVLKRFF